MYNVVRDHPPTKGARTQRSIKATTERGLEHSPRGRDPEYPPEHPPIIHLNIHQEEEAEDAPLAAATPLGDPRRPPPGRAHQDPSY